MPEFCSAFSGLANDRQLTGTGLLKKGEICCGFI